jgi:RimJ/RimL family protein N-acetyltransferase
MNDAAAYVALRRESLASAPLAFASSPEEDFALDPATLETYLDGSADEVILGAFADALVGAVGLFRDRHRKAAHKAHLWGMYVQPAHRGAGLGGKLLADAVKHARGLPGVSSLHLSVTTDAPGAQRLYEAAGFRAWGTQPDSLRHDDRSVAEIHMALSLSAPAPAT